MHITLEKEPSLKTIFDQLKNICQVEHSRHRSVANYFNNIFFSFDCLPILKTKNRL